MNPLFNQMTGANSILDRARSIMASMQNPAQLLQQYLPGVPQEIANDPNQIINWLQQTGRITPDQIQTASRLMGGLR